MINLIKKLSVPEGVSGYESKSSHVFAEMASEFCQTVEKDALGNVIATRKASRPNAPTIMLEAHADKTGLMIRHITNDGFLLFSSLGGIDSNILPASRVTIYGKEKIKGVICALPPHINKTDKPPDKNKLCIDTGYSGEKIEKVVRVGDIAVFDSDFTQLMGNMISCSALDDRAGLAVIIKTLDLLKDEPLTVNIAAVAAVQEEVGMRGAGAAAYHVNPTKAICIDTCHGITPDASENVFKAGGGVVITLGPNVQRKMSDEIIAIAKEKSIPFQIDVDSGNTGTDAWVIQTVRRGILTALLSLPLRYMHSLYEVLSIDDAEYTAQLLAEFLRKQGELC